MFLALHVFGRISQIALALSGESVRRERRDYVLFQETSGMDPLRLHCAHIRRVISFQEMPPACLIGTEHSPTTDRAPIDRCVVRCCVAHPHYTLSSFR